MTQTKRYMVRGKGPLAKEPHHYRACGLDDVYLKSGFTKKVTSFGPTVVVDDIPGLHQAIGHCIITDSKPISPREFRFLRKNMDLTQEALAERLKVDAQTIARYEKDITAIPGTTDTVLRIMFSFHIASPERKEDMLAELKSIIEDKLSSSGSEKVFGLTKKGWKERTSCEVH